MPIKSFCLSQRLFFLLCAVIICGAASAFADTLVMTSGQKIKGDFIKKTDMYVMLDVQGKPTTYYWGEIKSIDHLHVPAVKQKALAPVKPVAPLLTEQQAYFGALASFVKGLGTDEKKDALKDFVSQYPQGRFAQDAQFVDLMLQFGRELKKEEASASAALQNVRLANLEQSIESFPATQNHVRIQLPTSRFLRSKVGELRKICVHPESVLLPYGLAGYYAQGMLAFAHKDYAGSLRQFNFLKNAYEWKGGFGILGQTIFLQIMASELGMGNDGAALSTAKEAMEYFSNSGWSKEFYQFAQGQRDQWY